jgi:hypothetical protein
MLVRKNLKRSKLLGFNDSDEAIWSVAQAEIQDAGATKPLGIKKSLNIKSVSKPSGIKKPLKNVSKPSGNVKPKG